MAVAGYKLRVNGGILVDEVIDVGNVLTYDITGLTPDTEYDVEVMSYDAAGNQSEWSPIVSATTDPIPTPLNSFNWLGYYDAESLSYADGADIDEFTDQSGNNNHFISATAEGQQEPIMETVATLLNNKKAIVFDNEFVGMDATWNATGVCTVFIVGYIPSLVTSVYNILWGDRTAGNDYILGIQIFDSTWSLTQDDVRRVNEPFTAGKYIIRIEHRTTETRMFINGVDVTDDATSTKKPGTLASIGSVPAWQGGFFDDTFFGIVAVSDGLITGVDADFCEEYWADFYGITLP